MDIYHVINVINDRIVDSQKFDSMLLRDLSFIIISRYTWRHFSLTLGNPDDLFNCLKATSSAGLVRIWKQRPLMQLLQCNTYFMKSWKVHFLVFRVVECNVNTKRFIIYLRQEILRMVTPALGSLLLGVLRLPALRLVVVDQVQVLVRRSCPSCSSCPRP